MTTGQRPPIPLDASVNPLADLFLRSTGATQHHGNRLQLLRDSQEHESATLALIAQARHHIYIENYRICSDDWGNALLAALCQRASEGVRVCVLADWVGSWGQLSRRWRQQLLAAGGEFAYFNPLGMGDPLAWIIRNHRKLISVDSCEAIISGWCLSAQWRGLRGETPWRDTGIRIAGPIVSEAEAAFSQTWTMAGGQGLVTPEVALLCPLSDMPLTAENVDARLVVGRPQNSPLFRLDQIVISLAHTRIWLTDAYPVGTPAYLQGLRRAAEAGVDVRLLVPGSSDLPLIGLLARSSYRALLDAGVRVFEWNGSMLHAKTAVIDGHWARVGSSNLNPASWLGNYELDLVIEDYTFAQVMETQYLQDLENSTEIVLRDRQQVKLVSPRSNSRRVTWRRPQQAPATTLRVSRAVALAIRESRRLGPTDASLLGGIASTGLLFAAMAFWQPTWVAYPLGLLSTWLSISFLRIALRRYRDYRRHDPKAAAKSEPAEKSPEMHK